MLPIGHILITMICYPRTLRERRRPNVSLSYSVFDSRVSLSKPSRIIHNVIIHGRILCYRTLSSSIQEIDTSSLRHTQQTVRTLKYVSSEERIAVF